MIIFSRRAALPLLIAALALGGCAGTGTRPGAAALASTEPAAAIGSGPLTPGNLLGVTPHAIAARLGEPGFRRTEPGAEVWQYGGGSCSLFIYFYRTGQGALASSYVDARALRGGKADASSCLTEVLQARNVPVS